MISSVKASRIISKHIPAPTVVFTLLPNCISRVLAENVYAAEDAPGFDKSTMDGFAVYSGDLKSTRTILKIAGVRTAGNSKAAVLKRGECFAIATGALIPRGADSVVMKEDTRIVGVNRVEIARRVVSGENICKRGVDFKKGDRILKIGIALNMTHIALLASQGIRGVKVYAAPSVALLSTGNEIAESASHKPPAGVWNATAPMLLSSLGELKISARYLGIARDDEAALARSIKRGCEADILLITGAVSEGKLDLVPEVLRKCGAEILVHKVKIKPGKPFLFAFKGSCLIFGLPGNPVSSLVSYLLFVKPAVNKFLGFKNHPMIEEGILSKEVYNKSRRLYWQPMRLQKQGCRNIVTPIAVSGSADLLALAGADGFLMLGPGQRMMKKKSRVKFLRAF